MKIASATSTWSKSQRKPIWLWVAYLYEWYFSHYFVLQTPVVAFTASHLNAKQITVSFQKLLCLFLFSLQMCPGRLSTPTEPFHKKARTGFKRYKLAKDAHSSLTTSSPWVSLSQPTQYHDFVFHHIEHLLLCPPFKRIKVFLSPFVWEHTGFFANPIWGHFCLWPSEPPMNLVDLLHPQELMYVLDILHHFYCQTLQDCRFLFWLSGQFCRVERLLKCKLKKACQYLATIFTSL